MNKLLLEIGAEEIPAGYIQPALDALKANLLKGLTDARISHGDAQTCGTPRKLVVAVDNVAAKQESYTVEVLGPPEAVGLDANGAPTVAARKFVEKVGVSMDAVEVKETKKGRYLYAAKTEPAVASYTLLVDILPGVIAATPFPKTMKWGTLNTLFARPIISIMALLGDDVVPFQMGDITSGRSTQGHSFMHPQRIDIRNPDEYVDKLHSVKVIVDIAARRQAVTAGIADKAASVGGAVLEDPELVDIVTNLIEYPAPVVGRFDTEFLELPDEILITAMREHQKYFAVTDKKGRLMPCFIAVNNTVARDMDLVAAGHGRVIRARLADAQFFYRGDVQVPMDDWVEKLKGVLFQARLGSMHAKVNRVKDMALHLAEMALDDPRFKTDTQSRGPDLKDLVSRAAILSKADLVSQVVVEFPKLQGVMGRVYAQTAGEHHEAAMAIEEHYRPTASGGRLPETLTGAIVGIADKMDSICGCFSVGLIPTGASDPYALRRQGIGVIRIMLDKGLSFSLRKMISRSQSAFENKGEGTEAKIHAFLRNRISHLLAEEGFSKDVIAAITHVSVDHIPHVWLRVRALEKMKAAPDFEPLAVAFKRVVNIIRKADRTGLGDVDPSLFEEASESALFSAFKDVEATVTDHLARGDFEPALFSIASLRDAVDGFFDGVLVMTDDERLRNNRLSLLSTVAGLFGRIADFSKITT